MSENPAVIEQIQKEIQKLANAPKALEESVNRALTEMRATIDEQKKGLANTDSLVKEKIDKFAAEVESKQLALEKGVDAINAKLDRPGSGWSDTDEGKAAKEAFAFHKAKLAKLGKLQVAANNDPTPEDLKAIAEYDRHFATYLRRGERHNDQAFQASLLTGSDPDGGYLAPTTVSGRVISRVYETSPIREFATVETIGSKDIEMARDEGEFGAGWVGEAEDRPETATSQVGRAKIVAHEMFANPRVTQGMLEDAGLNIEAWIARKLGDKFSRVEATAFFTGNGTNKPRGFLTYPGGTSGQAIERIRSGAGTNITGDAFWDVVYALKDPYTPNARWMMNRLGLRQVMKLKDGQGNYLWAKGDIVAGQPATLCDYPVVRAADMPAPDTVSSFAAGSFPFAFGDFREAYTIVDRLGISTLYDNLTAKPYVQFYTRRRVGGDVMNFEALKLMEIGA